MISHTYADEKLTGKSDVTSFKTHKFTTTELNSRKGSQSREKFFYNRKKEKYEEKKIAASLKMRH